MSFSQGLKIAAVVMMGWVVAHSARVVLMSVAGHQRLPWRDLLGETFTGLGAFIIGWGLLPGGTREHESTMMMAGILVWVVGLAIQPLTRATSNN